MSNIRKVFSTLGASNHSKNEREENDYYATDPRAVQMLFDLEQFDNYILEPCCGQGHLSKAMEEMGKTVLSSDIIERNYGYTKDFFTIENFNGDIVTNPPYSLAQEFIEHSLKIVPEGKKVAMFLRVLFLESKRRKELFEKYPPKKVYVSSSRIKCAKYGDFNSIKSSALAYAWFVWEKGYKGETILKWFN